jgi:DNA polymerase-3 subunit epsilon
LLDAGLLSEVYIRLTRGQDSLVIHDDEVDAASPQADLARDLSSIELAVIDPTPEELAAHEAVLAELDKSSNGKTIWRTAVA